MIFFSGTNTFYDKCSGSFNIKKKSIFCGEEILRSNLKNIYTNIFYREFQIFNEKCILKFDTKYFSNSKLSHIFTAYSHCKFNFNKKYNFVVSKTNNEEELFCEILEDGNIECVHDENIFYKRNISKNERDIWKDELGNCGSIKTKSLDLMNKGGEKALSAGNFTDVPSEAQLRKIAHEKRKQDKLHQDDVVELSYLQRIFKEMDQESLKMKGFIRDISLNPFRVILCSELQLKCYVELSKVNKLVLFIDATGSILRIPNIDSRILYYAVVAKGPHETIPSIDK